MATYTSSVFEGNQPKAVHRGDQSVSGQIMWGAASSVGDVAFLAKIPHGATVIEIIEDHSITGSTALALEIGLNNGALAGGGADMSCFIAAGATATKNRLSKVGPAIRVSCSDLDTTRYAVLTARVASGSMSTSLVVNFAVIYRMDGPDPH